MMNKYLIIIILGLLSYSAKSQNWRIWATYYGGNKIKFEWALTIDIYDNIYLTGYTSSSDFPLQSMTGEYLQPTYAGGNYDAFILKFNNCKVLIAFIFLLI